ncbi:Structural maintenance of chromosomes protein 2 [Actinomortierella ambigua]|nr:Structural maintenance of chromosomes protein 2 [Actinomortierella ambigua]
MQAYVTLLTSDNYASGALVLAHSLRASQTSKHLAVLTTAAVSKHIRDRLANVYDSVIEIGEIDSHASKQLELLGRPELGITLTKIHVFNQTQFDKVVFLDADTLVLRNVDHLFDTAANGSMDDDQDRNTRFAASPDAGWPDCFNSGVFVCRPKYEDYRGLIEMANTEGSFDVDLVKKAPRVKSMQRDAQTLQLEIQQSQRDATSISQELSSLETTIAAAERERDQLLAQMRSHEETLEKTQRDFEHEKAQMMAYDEELKELEALSKQKSKAKADCQVEIQNLTHDLDRLSKEMQAVSHALQELLETNPWIADQKHLFGQLGGPYDFTTQNPGESRRKLKLLDEKQSAMKSKVNPKVMNMLENQEKRETSLKQMLATVQRDKKKIQDTIISLDNYKNEALEKTYSKVNSDFGAIFGDLLPGNSARLQPPEGMAVTDGLEVKVCLGGVWKNSLTELSGGQRSLIALSLILSLLQFKPAPMYILDEVDAALDLSHTQNIGQLLRTRFKGSQFIVVSLKEGMFNNANVLFRARFRDGISIVDRNAQNQLRNTHQRAAAAAATTTTAGTSSSTSHQRSTGKENRPVVGEPSSSSKSSTADITNAAKRMKL